VFIVMAGLDPAIHDLLGALQKKTWMPGTRPGMTAENTIFDRAKPNQLAHLTGR
jgi:hypothetical protein